ncbi:MAG: hypothetical protein KAS65_10185 [Candidatus Aminicenantes bacterium]|nr:hypothetical protein [Candidatus Aminicenantes bacterium]
MNEVKSIKCPACGELDYNLIKEVTSNTAPYGPEITDTEITYKCNICDSEFDYYDIIGEESESSLEISKKKSIDGMVNYLSNIGYNMAAIERALELPQRTISRWKSSKELSSIGIALLRIIRTYPWIIEVAEEKFDFNTALQIHIQNAVKDLLSIASFSGFNFTKYFDKQVIKKTLSIYVNIQNGIQDYVEGPSIDTKSHLGITNKRREI